MSKHMQRDSDKLLHDVSRMAGHVEDAFQRAAQALETHDGPLAERVIASDDTVDEFENRIQEDCLTFLAIHQPVAGDLRRISALLRITTDLERSGDLAVGLAEIAEILSHPPFVKIPSRLNPMIRRAMDMVKRSLNALTQANAAEARAVVRLDDEVDADNDALIHEIVQRMKSSAAEIDSGMALHAAVRYIERIADHATNIAEEVIYLVEGEMVRHKPEAFQDSATN